MTESSDPSLLVNVFRKEHIEKLKAKHVKALAAYNSADAARNAAENAAREAGKAADALREIVQDIYEQINEARKTV